MPFGLQAGRMICSAEPPRCDGHGEMVYSLGSRLREVARPTRNCQSACGLVSPTVSFSPVTPDGADPAGAGIGSKAWALLSGFVFGFDELHAAFLGGVRALATDTGGSSAALQRSTPVSAAAGLREVPSGTGRVPSSRARLVVPSAGLVQASGARSSRGSRAGRRRASWLTDPRVQFLVMTTELQILV